MNFLKKNKVIVIIIVVILVVLGGAWFFMGRGGSGSEEEPLAEEAMNIKQISPEDIGLSLELAPSGQAVNMKLAKLSGIKSIEYEISYDAEETDPESGETAVVPKGAVSGDPIMVDGKSEIEREILLGTCSANKCRYDKVQGDIKILVKVTYNNGDVAAAELTIPFEPNE